MIKIVAFISLLFVVSISCSLNETPEFIEISNIGVKNYSKETITLTSDLVFHNPNNIGGTIQVNQIKVWVNNTDLGNVNSSDFQVPSKKEFSVPVVFKIPYNRILKDRKNMVLNMLNALNTQSIEVHYKGDITYKLGSFKYDYPVDYTEVIDLK